MNTRLLEDKNLQATVNLPAAGASAITPSLDTATETPGRIENVELRVQLPATPALTEAKDITLTVKDSADDITFAAVAEIPATTVTGAAAAAGGSAVDLRYKLPIGLRRYVRLDADVEADGGANTDVSATIGFVF